MEAKAVKVTLIRTGDICLQLKRLPKKCRGAKKNTELINEISDKLGAEGTMRFNSVYHLCNNGEAFFINWIECQENIKRFFDDLKDNLRIVKM